MSSRLNATTRRLDAQQNKLDLLKCQQAELQEQLKTYQAHASTLEKHAADMDARIDKLREQMNSVTSNKEYSAMLLEINTLKADKGKVEDDALDQMNQVDELKQQIEVFSGKIAEQQKILAGADRDVSEASSEVGARLDEAAQERDAAAEKIPPDIRTMFNRLSEQYDGESVVQIEEQDRRRMEYICGGCYMTLPVERVNSLITRPDDLCLCPNCNRILSIHEDLKQAIGAK